MQSRKDGNFTVDMTKDSRMNTETVAVADCKYI